MNRCATWRLGLVLLGVILTTGGCATRRPPAGAAGPVPTAPDSRTAVEPRLAPSVMPRVMILVDEKNLGAIATAEVETIAIARLLEKQVPVVDQDLVRTNLGRQQQLLRQAGDARGAAALGAQFGADVVIVGEAVAKPSARRIGDTNLRAYQAVATLRAVRTDTSATLVSVSEDATVAALDDIGGSARALRAAGEKSVARIVPGILAAWTPAPGGGTTAAGYPHRLEATFGGVDQLWKLQTIREHLRGMDGVLRAVSQRSYTAGVAVFSMESAQPVETLAETLVMQPPEGLKLQVLDASASALNLRTVAAP
jgi:hypothetical protein